MLNIASNSKVALIGQSLILLTFSTNLVASSFLKCFSKAPKDDLSCLKQEVEKSYVKQTKDLEQIRKKRA